MKVTLINARSGDTLNGQVIANVVSDGKNVMVVFENGGTYYASVTHAKLTHATRPDNSPDWV